MALINGLNGILYLLYTRDGLGEFQCGDDLLTIDYDGESRRPDPGPAHKVQEDGFVSVKLEDPYREELIALLNQFLESSPIHTGIFLCCDRSLSREIVQGVFSADQFVRMICAGQIRTNVCYLIS